MTRYINRNLKIVSFAGILGSIIWAYLFYVAIADCGLPNDKYKYIYLLFLLLVSIAGIVNSNKKERRD